MRKYNIKAIFGVMTDVLFILISLVILILSFSKPSHNQLPSQIIPLTLVAGVLMLIFFAFLRFLCRKFPFLTTAKFFVILSAVYGIVLIAVSFVCRHGYATFLDYDTCYHSAQEYALTGTVTEKMYFSLNPHNWKCTPVLSFIMKIAYAFGMNDPYYLVPIAGTGITLTALYSCRYLLKEFFPDEKHLPLMLLACFVLCIPFYAYAQVFYTDSASFASSVTGIALITYTAKHVTKHISATLLYILSGIILAFGCFMKITSLIPLIASIIYILLIREKTDLRKNLKPAFIIALSFIILYVSSELICNRYSWYTEGKLYNRPAISYIAMGLRGDGTYQENMDFRQRLDDQVYSDAKTRYSIDFIKENFGYFVNPDHLIRKIRANYASGQLGAQDFAYYGYDGDTVLSRIFNPYGDLYWYGSKYNMVWQFQIYLIMLAGCIISLLRRKENPASALQMISELTFIGYFLFLMIWEANNRQLYNMIPVLLVGYISSTYLILKK